MPTKFDILYELVKKHKDGDLLVDLELVRKDADDAYNAGALADYEWKVLDRMLKEAMYVEPDKQILVVIGGVTFTSIVVGPNEAKHVLESVKRAAPNTDPMIVVANK